jgi:hypothetical protein
LHPYLDIDYLENQPLYGDRNFHVIDLSSFHKEGMAEHFPGIKTVDAGMIFKPGTVFLGFGLPNVYTARITENNEVFKFDVKSFHRAPSTIKKSQGIVQSGIFIVLKNAPESALSRVMQEAKKRAQKEDHDGERYESCAQGNYDLLTSSGFSIRTFDSKDPFYLPLNLLEAIIRNGILYEGQEVEFDIVKTTPLSLSEFLGQINSATKNTAQRHCGNMLVTPEYQEEARAYSSRIALENQELKRKHPPRPLTGKIHRIETSQPSAMGSLARKFWGAHPIVRIKLTNPKVSDYLPNILKAFPQENPDWVTNIKKKYLFSPANIEWIRSHMAPTFNQSSDIDSAHITSLLPVHSETESNMFNYVITDDYLILGRINVHFGKVDWVLAKHALLSAFSPCVRYAGQAYRVIVQKENGEVESKIVVDDDSGTYQSPDEYLPKVVELLSEHFPGQTIVGKHKVFSSHLSVIDEDLEEPEEYFLEKESKEFDPTWKEPEIDPMNIKLKSGEYDDLD